MSNRIDLKTLQGEDEKILAIFSSHVGSMVSPNVDKRIKQANKRYAIEVTTLYPDVVKKSKYYEQYLTALDELQTDAPQVIPESAYGHADGDRPEEVIIAEKYVHLYRSARSRKKDFNLTFADIKKLMNRKTCHYTGVKLTAVVDSPYQRTIDRVDNNKGYVKGNVVACSSLANQIKNELFENPTSSMATNLDFMKKLVAVLDKVDFEPKSE